MAATFTPPELFKKILAYFVFSEEDDHSDKVLRWQVFISRRQLGQLALVSRFWARQCQPNIFENITLRSKKDLVDLLAMASSPYSEIAQYIHELHLVYTPPCVPWIHLVSTTLKLDKLLSPLPDTPHASANMCMRRVCLPSCARVWLEVEGPLAANSLKNSIHRMLPKQLPTFSLHLQSFTLTSVHFRGIRDVFQLIAELPSLIDLFCSSLTWETRPSQELPVLAALYIDSVRRSRPQAQGLRCRISNTVDSWVAVAIVLALHLPNKWRLSEDDFTFLITISQASLGRDAEAESKTQCSCSSSFDIASPQCCSLRIATFNLRVPLDATLILVNNSPVRDSVRLSIIEKLVLDLLQGPAIEFPSDMIIWKAVDQYAASSVSLQYVVLGWAFREYLTLFVEEVEPQLQHLLASGKLRYALKHRFQWKAWAPGLTDRDLQRMRGVEQLEDLY